jgi:hypothetical protein
MIFSLTLYNKKIMKNSSNTNRREFIKTTGKAAVTAGKRYDAMA